MEALISILPLFENITFDTFITINLKPRFKPILFFLILLIRDLLYWLAIVYIPALSYLIPGSTVISYPWKALIHNFLDFLFIFLLATDPRSKKLLVFILSQSLLLFSDAITSAIFSLLTGISVVDITANMANYPAVSLIIKCLFIIIYASMGYVLTFFLRKRLSKNNLKEFTPSVLLIAIQLLLFCMSIYRQNGEFSTSYIVLLLFELAVCLLADMYLIVIAPPKAAENRILQEKLRCIEEVRSGEKEFFSSLIEKEHEMSALRHDWNNLLQVAVAQMEKGRTGGGIPEQYAFLQELADRVNETKLVTYCNNETINVLLNAKSKEMREAAIPFQISCVLPEKLNIDPLDLCSVFSNLIDNAMEYCMAHPSDKNEVKIHANTVASGRILIQIKNYARLSHVDFSKTTKANSERHGYGLDIVRSIASRYQGELTLTCEREMVTAAVSLTEEPEQASPLISQSKRGSE